MGDPKHLRTLEDLIDAFPRRGSAAAVVEFGPDGAAHHDYASLHTAIGRMAAGLGRHGLGAGDKALLWAPNSVEWIVAYFAILRCGATVVPLDTQTSVERVRHVRAHSAAKLAVTSAGHAADLEEALGSPELACVLIDGDTADSRHWRQLEPGRLERAEPDPERIASLLYTSGTTGTPKAVPLTHANLAANVSALLDAELIEARDVVLVPLPFHHVYPFTVGLLTVLATGARIVLPSGISGPEITRAASESGATALIAVPRLCTAVWEGIERGVRARGKRAERIFRVLLALSGALRRYAHLNLGKLLFRALHAKVGPRLHTLGCGGAQLDGDLARKLEAVGWTVLTGYGLTETSPVLTFNQHKRRKLGTEGIALPGVEIGTLEHEEYEHGEIIARGPNVFSGYWNNPEENRNAFTPDGWFKTGDLGWIDGDGYLHIAGRTKEVIVLPDGKNVYADEIEEEFAASKLIAEIAVLEKDGRLHALIVPDDQAIRDRGAHRVEELLKDEIAEVSSRLPRYQRLSDYRVTRTPLPRTPLGKLKRHMLADAYDEAATRKIEEKEPKLSNEDQKFIAQEPAGRVWSWLKARYPDRALTLETSPQLDLNIDSLEWVTLTLELEREFDVSLDGEAVSRIVTVRDLLAEVQTAPAPDPERRTGPAARTLEHPNAVQRTFGMLLLGLNRLVLRTMFRLEVEGLDRLPAPDAAFLIAPNHVSYLDPLAVAAAVPRRHLARVYWAGWVGKMYAGPFSRLVSRSTRVFPVEPDRDPGGAIALGKAVLESGHILVWFPEGARSRDGRLQRFQSGVGLLLENGADGAVPTAVLGAYEVWPRSRKYPRRGPVKIVFGRPMSRAELIEKGRGTSDPERIADALHRTVAALIEAHTR